MTGNASARYARFAPDESISPWLELGECAMGENHGAAQSTIANQQVATKTDPPQRQIGGNGAQESREILTITRFEKPIRWTTHMPRRVSRHGLVTTQSTGETGFEVAH